LAPLEVRVTDDKASETRQGPPGASERGATSLARAEARARLRNTASGLGPDMAVAAARAVAEIRLSVAARGAELGFLDDVVDFVDDVVDVTDHLLNHLVANTEEVTEYTPEITPLVLLLGVAGPEGEGVEVPEGPAGASAEQLLEARKQVLEATAVQRRALSAIADSLRAQIAAMRQPKS
jgi:hypothetical protein